MSLNSYFYSPFYITDDPVGGYEYKTNEEREVSAVNVKIYTQQINIPFQNSFRKLKYLPVFNVLEAMAK